MINEIKIKRTSKNDPLEEDLYTPIKSITHKYKNRVLLLATLKCHTYCDFCTRERKVHKSSYKTFYDEGLDYIEKNKEINDVILSGGDPLTLKDNDIERIIDRLNNIDHVKIVRIHTKICSHYPNRVTDKLIEILSKCKNLFINIHVSDLSELHDEAILAIRKLRSKGFNIGSQSVLQRSVNDNEDHLEALFNNLLFEGVKPYYIYQMDKTDKYDKYIVEEKRAIEIIKNLRKRMSGMAVPRLILDTNKYKEILA